MNKIAFFPGKFHPPHLGHLKTMIDISNEYDKLIIGVSGHMPDNIITTVDDIIDILKSLFDGHRNCIEVVKFSDILVEKNDTEGLPEFDILLSGNPDVLKWADNLGIKNKFVPRSEGYMFSGTEIRNELQDS